MVRPFLDVELAARPVEERSGAVRRHDLEPGLAVTAKGERALIAGRSFLAYEGRAGGDDVLRSALPGRQGACALQTLQVGADAKGGRPLIVPAFDHQVNLIPAAAGSTGVAGWPSVGHHYPS